VQPSAPPAAADIYRLEQVAVLGWPAPDTARLGGWLLRAADGWTGRANSVLPLDPPDRPVDAAVTAVEQWYADRGLPPRFQLPLPLCADLDEVLDRRGWRAYNRTLVRVADVAAVAGLPAAPGLPPATLQDRPTPDWLAAYHYRGGHGLPPVALQVMTAAADPVFASVPIDGTVAGIARAVVDEGWCGVTAVETVEAFRRRGVGRHLMVAVAQWAAGRGADRIYLQVAEENAAAQGMYDRLGFAVSHRYHYRTRP
jgi:ribosomal protein S18 acetylase RimI-like enzyme